jgi:hypothetical protein
MRKTTIDKLCEAMNKRNGLAYPMAGYVYFADIKGDGQSRRRVYCILNSGGVASCYNGKTYRHTAAALRLVLGANE